eukprot:13394152-Alexandrium_andersonii.AAC.1
MPRRCCCCAADVVACARRTPRDGEAGDAWCRRCLAPESVATEGADWTMHMLGLGGIAGPPAFTGHAIAGGVGTCPLCGCGEPTGEHLLLWCPAVAIALRARAYGTPCSLAMDPDATRDERNWLAAILHQASFRVFAWEGLPARQAAVAAAAIVRAAGRSDVDAA